MKLCPGRKNTRGNILKTKASFTVLNERNKEHCNWVSTICFYAAFHVVEMQLVLDGIHSKNHIDREENMQNSERIHLKQIGDKLGIEGEG